MRYNPDHCKRLKQIVEPLLLWYRKDHRQLPWRDNPSPYRVWVSEIMLQQTRVEAVKPYFERFLRELPTIQDLAECPEEKLLKLWEGLGYYSRVRNMQKCAQQVVSLYQGQFPADEALLKKLPGIGDYTAGAVASIAFDLPVPAVDGNVLRVLTRVLSCDEDITLPKTKETFRQLLLEVEPSPGAGDFNQSLMELGAMVCLPNGAPQCLVCPLSSLCQAHLEGKELLFPVKPPKKERKIQERTLFLFDCQIGTQQEKYTLLHQREAKGVLAGMWEFPAEESALSKAQADCAAHKLCSLMGLDFEGIFLEKPSRHIFTHIEWKMSAWQVRAFAKTLPQNLPDGFLLVPVSQLGDTEQSNIALPSAFKAYRKRFVSSF